LNKNKSSSSFNVFTCKVCWSRKYSKKKKKKKRESWWDEISL